MSNLDYPRMLFVVTLASLTILATVSVLPTFAQTNPSGTQIATNELKLGNSNGACETIGGTWNSGTSTCALSTNLTLDMFDSLTIDSGITLTVTGIITNIGSVINNGTIINNGNITSANTGIIINNGGNIINSDYINNGATIVNYGGTITNSGTIINKGNMANSGGTINNSGTLNGRPILNTDAVSSGYPINTKCEYMIWIFSQNGYSDLIFKKVVEKGLVEQVKHLYDNQSQELTNFYQNLYQNYAAGGCNSEYAPAGCEQQLNTLVNKHKQELNTFFINPILPSKFTSLKDFGNFEKEALNETECLSFKNTLQSTSSSSTQNPSTVTPSTIYPNLWIYW